MQDGINKISWLNSKIQLFNDVFLANLFLCVIFLASLPYDKPSHLVEDAAIRLSLGSVRFFFSRPGFQTVKCIISDPVSDLTLSIDQIHYIRIGMARMWEASYQKYVASLLFSQGPSYYTQPESSKEVHPLEVLCSDPFSLISTRSF